MKSWNSFLNGNDGRRLALGLCMTIWLAVLGSFIVATGQVLTTNDVACEPVITQANDQIVVSDLVLEDQSTNHFPFFPQPVPIENGSPDDIQVDDDSFDESGKLFCALQLTSRINLDSGKRQFSELELSIARRTSISLFVLHHSWRTFLS